MVSVSRALSVFIFVWGTSVSATADMDVVKMSNSGLCHPPQSNWYERTKNYRAFDSLAACLDSGGELPEGMSWSSLEGLSNHQVSNKTINDRHLVTAGTTPMGIVRTAGQRH